MEFTIRYDDAVIYGAVDTFVKRRILTGMGQLGLVAVVLAVGGLAYLLWQGDRSWFVGAIGAVLLFFAIFFVVLWRLRHAETKRLLMAIPSRQGTVTLSDDQISIATEAGATSLPWKSICEIWKLEACWLLFLAPNNFITLPTDGVPLDALEFIDRRSTTSG